MILGACSACAVGLLAAATSNAAKAQPRPAPDSESSEESLDHTIIVGIGGAMELELGDGSLLAGGNVMVEWDAVEDWLEFEVGASVLPAPSGAEVPIDLMFWPTHRFGFWFEPAYDVVFHDGTSHGLGSSGGLLVGW